MFCPRCGTNLTSDAEFCSNCGTKINEFKNNQVENNNATITEKLTKKSKKLIDSIKQIIKKYKKQLLILSFILIIGFVILLIYGKLFGFEKLKWNKEYNDYSLEYVSQTNISLGIQFSNEQKLNDLKIDTTCGEYTINDLEITWDLSNDIGKCSIEVKYKLKKIKKTYTVINSDDLSTDLSLDYTIDYDSDEDYDSDGLTNKQEKEYGTDPKLYDTDMDGLDDYYEIFTSKTDPNKEDTDGDGVSDYDEIELGLNPLKTDSKGDGTKDSDRKVSYTVNEEGGISLEVIGKGNLASTTVNTFENSSFEDVDGLINKVYNFYTDGTITSATVKIPYTLEELEENNIQEDNLTLFYFNEDTKELEEIQTRVDKENKVIIATLKHFSKYILGDKNTKANDKKTQILMVIDNSYSMYSVSQLKELGVSNFTSDGNDPEFKRLSLTNNLINMLKDKYYFGISSFAGKYYNIQTFTNKIDDATKAVNKIKNNFDNIGTGTNIVGALTSGISEFTDTDNNNYLILLTDGKDTTRTLNSKKAEIINNAKAKKTKVCVIGLGDNVDSTILNSIAEQTGCDFYNASDASALSEIYSIIASTINYNLIDIDDDGTIDGTILADSGFIVTRDGFSFKNYGTTLSNGGHCYGMATFAELYYTKNLPMKLDGKTTSQLLSKYKSYAYNLKGTYFENYANLYDYKLKSNILKYTFGYKYFDEDKPSNFYTVKNNTLTLNDTVKKEMEDSKVYNIVKEKSPYSAAVEKKNYGATFKYYEWAYLDEEAMQTSSLINKSDKELFNAIYTSFIKQFATKNYSSATDFTDWLKDKVGTLKSKTISAPAFIEVLEERLNTNDAPVIFSTSLGHAVNAISLIQDNNDAYHYYVGIYDNNYPGEKRYFDLQCTKKNCVLKANDNYSDASGPLFITLSLEDDLEYFN
jgi:hypothetical protein